MTYAIETYELCKRFGKHWALRNCSFQLPTGSIAGLVGLNGAGKTTLLHLATGLTEPSAGIIQVLGKTPFLQTRDMLPDIGFVAQENPLYRRFSVAEMLTLGRKLNQRWDQQAAMAYLEQLSIPLKLRVGKLSGGQRAQLALIMALAKLPRLLLLDEPFANVDPLARREFMKILLETAAANEITVLLSSHLVSELDNICDYLLILSDTQIQVADDIEDLLASHKLLIGPRQDFDALASTYPVLQASHSGRQSSVIVHSKQPIMRDSWQVNAMSLEDIVLTYLALKTGSPTQTTLIPQEVLK